MHRAATSHPIPHLLHVTPIAAHMTGLHTTIVSNSSWPTFYFDTIKCRLVISIYSSTSGQLPLRRVVMTRLVTRRSTITLTCTTRSIRLLLATYRGKVSLGRMVVLFQTARGQHGWIQSLKFGS